MKDFNSNKDGKNPSASFVVGAVALLFLIVGYQAALFIRKASVARIIANHDEPDTVFVYAQAQESETEEARSLRQAQRPERPASDTTLPVAKPAEAKYRTGTYRKNSEHSIQAEQIRRNHTPRKYESFRFDPNTVSVDDLMRLGFTQKQAQSIDNYRRKGGRFRRKNDFAKSYVVEDSVFRRLEKYIDIPKIDINLADSATFMSLPGIGKFFAGKMVSYRKELRGYSYPEQLMDIWHFDQEKFDNLKDLIKLDTVATPAYSLWTLPEKGLAAHPYIGKRAARSIIIFRENSPKADWTVSNLQKAGILPPDKASKLARCRIAPPPGAD
ncbi:MAG TPA: hypothetical protein DDX40_04270 [Rikenellaceae bacterium]|nr:hypothetical protein [Rikenellaceae bacterium]